ncbi:hypothetical protein D3W54_08930 [Komagataeibacter medellinensis]|uniref:Uncharacterized protein n=1 Tax=Komagataeibacter medellinensis TaxID=1177712 RepID=A0ABQ6W0P7_9PROT|nr:hypothetical protein D3W54_08930 [Komagataeibacter medellinensis]
MLYIPFAIVAGIHVGMDRSACNPPCMRMCYVMRMHGGFAMPGMAGMIGRGTQCGWHPAPDG